MTMNINELKRICKADSKSKARTKPQMRRLDRLFMEAILFFRDVNLFGREERFIVPSKPWHKRNSDVYDPVDSRDACVGPSGDPFNSESCYWYSEGVRRWRKYFKVYYLDIDKMDKPQRSENESKGGVNLGLIDPAQDKRVLGFQLDLERAKETDKKKLDKLYKIPLLKKEIDFLLSELITYVVDERLEKDGVLCDREYFENWMSYTSSTKKDTLLKMVIKARKLLQKFIVFESPEGSDSEGINWTEDRIMDVEKQIQDRLREMRDAFATKLNNEIADSFYSFEDTLAKSQYSRDRYRVSIPYSNAEIKNRRQKRMERQSQVARSANDILLSQSTAASKDTDTVGVGGHSDMIFSL